MGGDRQRYAESKAYSILSDLEDELLVYAPRIPHIYWMPGLRFETTGLDKRYKAEFLQHQKEGRSYYERRADTIFLASTKESLLAEEVGHFLHYSASNVSYRGKCVKDALALSIITEMIGFFCSKLIAPERSASPYTDFDDLYYLDAKDRSKAKEDISKALGFEPDMLDFQIYQQGYGLGELLHDKYRSGDFSLARIQWMMTHPLDEKGAASNLFVCLKSGLCPPKDAKKEPSSQEQDILIGRR